MVRKFSNSGKYTSQATKWNHFEVSTRPRAIPNPESESKDESGFDSGFGIMCSGIGFEVGIV